MALERERMCCVWYEEVVWENGRTLIARCSYYTHQINNWCQFPLPIDVGSPRHGFPPVIIYFTRSSNFYLFSLIELKSGKERAHTCHQSLDSLIYLLSIYYLFVVLSPPHPGWVPHMYCSIPPTAHHPCSLRACMQAGGQMEEVGVSYASGGPTPLHSAHPDRRFKYFLHQHTHLFIYFIAQWGCSFVLEVLGLLFPQP